MLHLPIALRESKGQIRPMGPNFKNARTLITNISGNKIILRVPKHKPQYSEGSTDFHNSGLINPYLDSQYEDRETRVGWQIKNFFQRSWRFCGPLFTGVVGEIRANMVFCRKKLTSVSDTAFDPQFFENAVLEIATNDLSTERIHWAQTWRSPTHWRTLKISNIFGVTFSSLKILGGGECYRNFAFPIADDVVVFGNFYLVQSSAGTLEEMDSKIDRAPMEKLCDDIIASIEVTLSESSQAQLERAQKEFPNAQLSPTMEPLKWTTPEEDAKHAEYLKNPQNY